MGKLHKAAGYLIFEEVFNLDEYTTSDWVGTKLTGIPTEYLSNFQFVAGGFSTVSYRPIIEPEKFQRNELQGFYSLHMLVGYHFYLRERSLRTDKSPFRYNLDHTFIKDISKRIFSLYEENLDRLQATKPANEAFEFARLYAKENVELERFREKGRRLRRRLFRYLTYMAMVMGYNFAHEALFPQIPLDNDWPEKVMKLSG